jgi:hypothetical protein
MGIAMSFRSGGMIVRLRMRSAPKLRFGKRRAGA